MRRKTACSSALPDAEEKDSLLLSLMLRRRTVCSSALPDAEEKEKDSLLLSSS